MLFGSDKISVGRPEVDIAISAGRSRDSYGTLSRPGSNLALSPLHSGGRLSHTGVDERDFEFDGIFISLSSNETTL